MFLVSTLNRLDPSHMKINAYQMVTRAATDAIVLIDGVSLFVDCAISGLPETYLPNLTPARVMEVEFLLRTYT